MTRIFQTGKLFPLLGLLLTLLISTVALAQTTAFTYQGRLTNAGNLANGNYDLQFKLYDTATVGTGSQQDGTLVRNPVVVSAGVFTVTLDFGANVFGGTDRYLEIGIRPANSTNAYTVLAPRQPVTAAPYAIQTLNAQQLGGLPPSRFVQADVNGNVGIGISPNASFKLDVNGQTLLRPGGSGGGFIVLHTPNSETGLTINGNGTNRADLRFDGATLKLVATTAGIPPATNGIVITTGGNVGIGTAAPSEKLQVISSGFDTAVAGQSDLGSGVYGFSNSGRGVYGIAMGNSFNQIGVEGFSNGGLGFGVFSSGFLGASILGSGGFTQLCRNTSNQVATCGSSLRYKEDLQPYVGGLNVIHRLQPLAFRWKSDHSLDVGFGAEAVAKIEPLLVTRNEQGEIEGVKYDRLSVVLVNAFKEQQAQLKAQAHRIAIQQQQLKKQQQRLQALRKLVCQTHPQAAACQE